MSRFMITDGFSGFFDPDDLNELLARLADRDGLEVLARARGDGLVFCEGPTATARQGISGLSVGRIGGLIDGRPFVVRGPLATEFAVGQRWVYLRLSTRWIPIRDVSSGLLRLDLEAEFSPDPGEPGTGTSLKFARLKPAEASGGNVVLDESWWPATARIDADLRSSQAAGRLRAHFPVPPPVLAFFLPRLERLAWINVLPELIRTLVDRDRTHPDRLAALGKAAASDDDAEVAAGLLSYLEQSGLGSLPQVLEHRVLNREPRLLRLVAPLTLRSETREMERDGWVHRCIFRQPAPEPSRDDVGPWYLVLVLRGASRPGPVPKVIVDTGGEEWENHLSLSGTPQVFGLIDRPGDIQVAIPDAIIEAAGAYRDGPDRPARSPLRPR
jgi:hypothetical protein